MKYFRRIYDRLTREQKAWLAALLAELAILLLMSIMVLPVRKTEKEFEVNLMREEFDFEELKKNNKIEIPDVDEYIRWAQRYSRTSNEWLKKAFRDETQSEDEASETESEPTDENYLTQTRPSYAETPAPSTEKTSRRTSKPAGEIKNYKGEANIKFYLPERYKIRMVNPIYTCPDYMHGIVTVRIWVDRYGTVRKAEIDPAKSSASYQCLWDTALEYAYKARFNRSDKAPELQEGYIRYYF